MKSDNPPTPAVSEGLFSFMQTVRRKIHRFPELSYKETRTASLVCRELERMNIPYRRLALTGIRAEIKGKGKKVPAGCVALRADMDALPIRENTGLPFCSEHQGIMHACGHDGHVAMLLGAAELLSKGDFSGKVVLLFQPAEEAGNGAAKMVEEGGLDGVEMIFGGHIDTHFPAGQFTVDQGLICSYADPFIIRIHGKGGHAARPHEAVDSVVLAATLVMNMQTLVSRQINPSHAAVVTVGRLQAGTVLNAIAEEAVLEGTIRSAHPETRRHLRSGLRRLIQGVQDMSNGEIELEFLEGMPAVINEPVATEIARAAAVEVVGKSCVGRQEAPSLGGEDFAFYQQHIPGCLVRFGAAVPGDNAGPAHSARYDFDETVLRYGADWLQRAAGNALLFLQSLKAEEAETMTRP